jgi:hypothetical protein
MCMGSWLLEARCPSLEKGGVVSPYAKHPGGDKTIPTLMQQCFLMCIASMFHVVQVSNQILWCRGAPCGVKLAKIHFENF